LTRWQKLRAGLGAAALLVGLAGMALEVRALVWVAVALLAPAFLLRFTDRRTQR
jgi:membrane protein implicated in regulation of membrane protease activity